MLNAKHCKVVCGLTMAAIAWAGQLQPSNVFAQSSPRQNSGIKTGPQSRTANFRADAATPKVPKVTLTKREQAICKVAVGDSMPAVSLPQTGGGDTAKLDDLKGKTATVVVLWKSDRRMALEELADLGPNVIDAFGKDGVSVVGIAVQETAESAQEAMTKAGAKFPNLLDADGKTFAEIGSERLPRTYVLDADGKIVWFDIEYSLTTRRELNQTLHAITTNL